jgi:hypothetical protein
VPLKRIRGQVTEGGLEAPRTGTRDGKSYIGSAAIQPQVKEIRLFPSFWDNKRMS